MIIVPYDNNIFYLLYFNSYSFLARRFFLFTITISFSLISCKSSKTVNTSSSGKVLSDKERIDFEYLFLNANKEKLLGNYESAEILFMQALQANPNSGATMYELANIYAFQNNKKQALYYSKRAAESDTKNIWYQILYAECLKDNKQPAEVAGVYQRLLKEYPDRIDFYYELANAYLYMNKAYDAIKTYDKIENKIGITEDASLQKIKIYRATKNYDKGIHEVKKLIIAFPKESKYYGMLGELYQDKGENDKALEAYNDLLKIDSTNAYVHLALAEYYRKLKQDNKAFNELKTAFRNDELDIDAKINILISYYAITEKNHPELKAEADVLCNILVAIHPDDAKAFSMYGDFLFRDRKMEEARNQYRRAIELDKEKYALWNQLLFIESELKDYVAMLKESKEAIELFPNQPLPYFFNGDANMRLKKYQDAVNVLEEGKEFVYGDTLLLVQFYANIGDAQNQLKNHALSDAAYEKALSIDPNNSYVLNNYAYYLSLRKKNLDKAAEMSKRSNELEPNNNSYQDTYGWIFYQMGKYEDAKTWIKKALENGGRNNGTLLEHYGDILYQLGNKEEALKYWIDAQKAGGASDLIDKKVAEKKLYE